jgi:hypothetical protein
MELVIFMVFMVLGYKFFGLFNDNVNRNNTKPAQKCHEIDEIHDWSYHPVTKRLTCIKCNFEAYSE